MGEIYRNCQNVVIWLGDRDSEMEYVVDFTKSTFEEIEHKVTARPRYRDSADIAQLYMFPIKRHVMKELFRPELLAGWRCFEHVLQRTWWTRAWIVQEFCNAPNATFHIGDISMDWTLISALIIVFSEAFCRSRESGSSVLSDVSRTTVSVATHLVSLDWSFKMRILLKFLLSLSGLSLKSASHLSSCFVASHPESVATLETKSTQYSL